METFGFDPDLPISEVRRRVEDINRPEHREMVAKLTWLDGTAKDQSLHFLYDPMADRFGHSIDKSSLHTEILNSLYNGIPVKITLTPRRYRHEKG